MRSGVGVTDKGQADREVMRVVKRHVFNKPVGGEAGRWNSISRKEQVHVCFPDSRDLHDWVKKQRPEHQRGQN